VLVRFGIDRWRASPYYRDGPALSG